ncbi:MAG: glycosyltransferase, partial [Phycisphaerae bacterium]
RFRHVVFTLRKAGQLTKQLPDHVACHALNVQGASHWAWLPLAKALRSNNVTLLHARNSQTWWDGTVAAVLAGAKPVLGFHGFEDNAPIRASVKVAARLARWMQTECTAVSNAARAQLAGRIRLPEYRTTVIPNGVDDEFFNPVATEQMLAIRKAWGCDAADFVIGIVGSLTPVKGHEWLIRAFSEMIRQSEDDVIEKPGVPRALPRLLIIGDGPLRDSLRQLVNDLKLQTQVIFTGARENIRRELSAIDLYVCASHNEGLSNALLEAMAARRAIIATKVGGNVDLLEDGRWGRLIMPGDTGELAAAIREFWHNHDTRATAGDRAAIRAAQFSDAAMVESYERYYEQNLYAASAHHTEGPPRQVPRAALMGVESAEGPASGPVMPVFRKQHAHER